MSDVADMSEAIELAVLRERVKNLEELADHHRGQLKDPERWHQQAMEQRGASQRTVVEQRATASMTEKGQFRPVVVSCKVRLLGASPDTTEVRTTGLLTAGRNPRGQNGPPLPAVDDRRQEHYYQW